MNPLARRTPPSPWGIGAKFTLFVALSVAVFLTLSLAVAGFLLSRYAITSADEIAEAYLDQTEARFARFFDELKELAQGLAATHAVRRKDPAGMRDLFLATVAARRSYLRAVYVGTASGAMHEWGEGTGFVDHVPAFPPGYDPRERPWYALAAAREGFSVTAPYRFASVDALGITCVLPLRAKDGRLEGVLGLDILLDDLASVLESLDIPKGGRAALLGPDGSVLASQFTLGDAHACPPTVLELAGGAARGGGTARRTFVGRVDGVLTRILARDAPQLGWTIVVGMPYDTALAPVRRVLNLLGVSGALLMALLAFALSVIARRLVVRPLERVVAVVNRLESGDRAARVGPGGSDEFGLLGREIDKLADAVDANARELEEKVRRRTEAAAALLAENERLRLLEERRRISRDLHDSIGAKLTNVFFCNGVARELARGLPGGPPEGLSAMHDKIETNCLAAVTSLKEIVLGLRDEEECEGVHETGRFADAIAAAAGERLDSGGITLDARIRARRALDALPDAVKADLRLVFDELVSNTLRHSGAARARLRLRIEGGMLRARFSDDGQGFDPGEARGMGLRNIRYRIERLGGRLRISSRPGGGASFAFTLPLPVKDAADASSPALAAERV